MRSRAGEYDWLLARPAGRVTEAFYGLAVARTRMGRHKDAKELWQRMLLLPPQHHSSPTSYSIDGRQYIAVPTGWGGWVEGFVPGMLGAPHGAALFAFALPE